VIQCGQPAGPLFVGELSHERPRLPETATCEPAESSVPITSAAATSEMAETNVDVGAAPAQISAHPFPDLGLIQHDAVRVEVGANRTGPAGCGLMQQGDRRTDLARCAISTLEPVVVGKEAHLGPVPARESQPGRG
jgi:hypothetical protein